MLRARVSAQLSAVRSGLPPVADVALLYHIGLPPRSIVVDVIASDGTLLGSATVPGGQRFVEVTLVTSGAGMAARATIAARSTG